MCNRIRCQNKKINNLDIDVLYHFGLATDTSDFRKMFSDLKFVIMGGSPKRMKAIAEYLLEELSIELPCGTSLSDIAGKNDRYEMYKVGPILSISHGMGIPSISIMLHELTKMLSHAGCTNVTFFRLGTCGGLGLEPGSVVVTTDCVDCCFQSCLQLNILGSTVKRSAQLDKNVVSELIEISNSFPKKYEIVSGKTMCANDFYEEQARLDGAICEYTEKDRIKYLKAAYDEGIRNIEMESLGFAAFCQYLRIPAAVICVTLIDRLRSDQIDKPSSTLHEWEKRPLTLLVAYLKKHLKQSI